MIKTAHEILSSYQCFSVEIADHYTEYVISTEDAELAMKEFAAQFIDLAAEQGKVDYKEARNGFGDYENEYFVNKDSILEIKKQIK